MTLDVLEQVDQSASCGAVAGPPFWIEANRVPPFLLQGSAQLAFQQRLGHQHEEVGARQRRRMWTAASNAVALARKRGLGPWSFASSSPSLVSARWTRAARVAASNSTFWMI